MATADSGVTRVPVRVADCFLLAHDDFMRRTRQGRHITQSIIELDRLPDVARLRPALARLVKKHPLLVGRLRRDWKTWLPYWEVPTAPDRGLPLGLWRERGSAGVLTEATEVAKTMELLQDIMTQPLEVEGIHFKARLDIVEGRDGGCCAALSWSHLLIDGKGAELLLAEIGRLCDGVDEPCDVKEPVRPEMTFQEKIKKTKAAVYRLEDLAKIGAPSLAGPRPRRGRGHYQVITLSAEDSAKLNARVEGMAGALFPMTFYVACAARAHDRVFQHRGKQHKGYVVSVPVQTRKRGARGPLFHNQVSIFFFSAVREALGTIEAATAAMKQQFAEMTRGRLDESFLVVLEMMMRLPSWMFMKVVRWQFKGEMCSFFHSHTGAFAPEMIEFAGAKITNAYHLPCLATPPGTGLFFCEREGQVNITLTWREGCLSDEERRLMLEQTMEDLFGEPRPDLIP
ncbi:hypothetical protein CfE428DRAFT_0936 [Chthoniobacter flavus Ellin428]|uniref:Condensation domain protein n=1 Tax=Chthoniobacter flavus Ellin428 TaxID=497964 RepID=B4CW99_9BACT|nr:hypothetical protein [Chthoniobacter flavus]EDY21691.1 hypothetical protein CfE428DRAFT_0936 [Chthoniobacter flavus Ellin428]TCO95628.1 hypothetical protein EV701_101315 [Chthoniobacter flavus]